MSEKNICEITGCGCLAMGCADNDGCMATRLCQSHYFLVKQYFERGTLHFVGAKPSDVFGEPNHWELKKMYRWYSDYQQKLSVRVVQ